VIPDSTATEVVHAFQIQFQFHQYAHLVTQAMEMVHAFLLIQFWQLAHQDIPLTVKADAFWSQANLYHQSLLAQVDSRVMETEIALLIQFLNFVHLDSTVMEMETVFQAQHHFQQFVHQDKQAMEMETAYQFQLFQQFLALTDSKQMDKEDAFL
jgi:hypothetical protein